jgi:hypothetical protein
MKHNWDTAVPYVYFLECAGHDLIKIGCTATGVHLRVRTLQQSSPFDLVCIGMMPANERTETDLHRQFAHIQHKNEWFFDCSELRAFIDAVCPNFDYAKSQHEAMHADLLRRVKAAVHYNWNARSALHEICFDVGAQRGACTGWIDGRAYPTPELIKAAHLFFERGCDKLEPPRRKPSDRRKAGAQ